MRSTTMLALAALILPIPAAGAAEYTLDGTYEGCEYGLYYGIQGGGLLECRGYAYSYDYMPTVIANGTDVVSIGGQEVDAVLSNGSMIVTKVVDEFEGCDFDKRYELDNGLVFVCQSYAYSYAYRPEVRIAVPEHGPPVVSIKGKVHRGQLYRR